MRALQLLGPSTGGIRMHVAALADGLERLGVVAPVLGPAGVLDGRGTQAGVVPVPAGTTPVGLLRARRALAPWREDADVLHAHGLKAAWVAVRGRPRRPMVITVHNVVLDETAGRAAGLQRRLEQAVLARADRVIAPSDAIAEGLGGTVARDRIRVVVPVSPPALPRRSRADIRGRLGISDDTPLVSCVARLHPQKDLPTLLRAFVDVAARVPDARLAVVGDGPDRSALEAESSRLGLDDVVRWVGFDADAVDWIAASDVFALSSVWEAIPLVLPEAMALGVPVVSTDVGMASELLGDGRAGAVVDVGDDRAMADALVRFLEDRSGALAAGDAGREVASTRFDPDALTAEVLDVYRELVPAKGTR